MVFDRGKFGDLTKVLTHSIYNADPTLDPLPPLSGKKMLLEDAFDMLLEDNSYMLLED